MAKQEIQPIEDEKEKKAIEWENNVLFILMPSVGLIAFLFGLIGAIFALSSTDPAFKDSKVGTAVFLIILAVLGAGHLPIIASMHVASYFLRYVWRMTNAARMPHSIEANWTNLGSFCSTVCPFQTVPTTRRMFSGLLLRRPRGFITRDLEWFRCS